MITYENVTKRYGGRTVVDDVTFTAPAGAVTAFLGPNGAGKSTSMRILAGLSRADSGAALVNGQTVTQLPNPGRVVGLMLDASALHRGRTCAESVQMAAAATGVGTQRARDALDAVGLGAAAGLRVAACSLGMRQRLGLAVALVGRPRALVLDEPFNGLDPEAIHDLRSVLRDFSATGGAVLLSSHLLGEVQSVADRLVVLRAGTVVANGSAPDLTAAGRTRVRAERSGDLQQALTGDGLQVTAEDGDWLTVAAPPGQVGHLALAAGIALTGLEERRTDLTDLFLTLTSGDSAHDAGSTHDATDDTETDPNHDTARAA
ncbi:ABC transporter ATP-binding protein [Pseudactinotalea sp. Z1732]|uniref:ABC transporter ATP-binding protein n=1 Tax=Micrococcales TaxID=85006 RepID=UPI003C7C4593